MFIILTTLLICTLVQEVFKYHNINNHINDLYFQTILSVRLSALLSLITNYLATFFMLLF